MSGTAGSPFVVKAATAADVPLILNFIRQLADYEKLLDTLASAGPSLGHRRAIVRGMLADRSPHESAAALDAAIQDALACLGRLDEMSSQVPLRPGGWCARETLGHLIDSACNNHRRFVVGQMPGLERFDGYVQDEWVDRQQYREESWQALVALWTAYNRHLAHVMRHTSDDALARTAMAPDGSRAITVRFLMDDYVNHLQHHVAQVREFVDRQPRGNSS